MFFSFWIYDIIAKQRKLPFGDVCSSYLFVDRGSIPHASTINVSDTLLYSISYFTYGMNLHSFVKKDQKTPKKDLQIALKRKKEIDNAND
jgi:hypothetical protein